MGSCQSSHSMPEVNVEQPFLGNGESQDVKTFQFSFRKLLLYAGPGILMSIAYVDPGNLEGDLQVGYQAGYKLGWVILWSTALGFIVQLLAVRLAVVTGKNLAEQCTAVYPLLPRTIIWLMIEIALIGSDIQEVIGSAIAIQLLSRGVLPLWAGVLITGADTFVLLLLEQLGARQLELFFAALVGIMTLSFGWMYAEAGCPTAEVAMGTLIPTIRKEWIPTAMGMMGALVMPHNIYLHSALVQKPRMPLNTTGDRRAAVLYNAIESGASLAIAVVINLTLMAVFADGFHHSASVSDDQIGLSRAGEYFGEKFGESFKYVWAVGLLAAGQSSTMTGTYTGQRTMEGFMNIRMPPTLRILMTRSVALVPTIAVAVTFAGSSMMDSLNDALNVVQSVQLPFALIPVLYITSRSDIMGSFFATKSAFRVLVQGICFSLLLLNLVTVSLAFSTNHMLVAISSPALRSVLLLVAVCYTLFVLYLLVGPAALYRALSHRTDPPSLFLLRTFARPRRDAFGTGHIDAEALVSHTVHVSQTLIEG